MNVSWQPRSQGLLRHLESGVDPGNEIGFVVASLLKYSLPCYIVYVTRFTLMEKIQIPPSGIRWNHNNDQAKKEEKIKGKKKRKAILCLQI